MEVEYKHTQIGVLTIVILLLVGLLIAPIAIRMIDDGQSLGAIVMIALFLLILVMFYALTVQISEGKLKFWFGIGIFSKTYSLDEIQSVKAVKDPWYYFWGIKSIPGGWLYAIAPGEALEIEFEDGKIVHLGTNQSEKLKQVMDEALEAGSKPNSTSEI